MTLRSLSPLDGRYHAQTAPLSDYFSEFGLIRFRVLVEVRWLSFLSQQETVTCVRAFTGDEHALLTALADDFTDTDAQRVKEIEAVTKHDVKAVEYFLRERLAGTSLEDAGTFVHFCCTSEDINNLAYALMLKGAMTGVWLPAAAGLIGDVADMAHRYKSLPMLSRTHGQAATPTTLGKEMAVFSSRLQRQWDALSRAEYLGKMNGAVGCFNVHCVAVPDADWPALSHKFVTGLGLTPNMLTTQSEAHDFLAEIGHGLLRYGQILLDFSRDIWAYVSLGYFTQRVVAGEVGSSTMPHKVNPILFENAEANVGLAHAILSHLADKLPVSRLQRDLSDSSALRNLGSGLGYSLLAVTSARAGIGRLGVSEAALSRDLDGAWETLAEPVQTVMKACGVPDAYEQLKDLTRGAGITRERLREFVEGLDIPAPDKARLLSLTPHTYVGVAARLVEEYIPLPPAPSPEAGGGGIHTYSRPFRGGLGRGFFPTGDIHYGNR